MPRKQKSLSLTELRDELVGNCDNLIEQCEITIARLQPSEATTEADQTYITAERPSVGANTASTGKPYSPDSKTISGIISPKHGDIVQEWIIFLDAIFGRAILHFLKMDTPDRLPKRPPIYLNKIKPSSLSNIRKSISEAAKDSFSHESYPTRITTLRGIFGIKEAQLKNPEKEQIKKLNEEMKKHVTIRNVFQHSRGRIREYDLAKLSPKYFELLNKNGNIDKYYENDDIILSMPEIENLNQTIEVYSRKFEVLS